MLAATSAAHTPATITSQRSVARTTRRSFHRCSSLRENPGMRSRSGFPSMTGRPDETKVTAMSTRLLPVRAAALVVSPATAVAAPSWLAPQSLSFTGRHVGAPRFAADAAGNAVAAWKRSNGTHYLIQTTTRAAAGAWSAPQDLSTSGADATGPRIAVSAAGDAVALWSRANVIDPGGDAAGRSRLGNSGDDLWGR